VDRAKSDAGYLRVRKFLREAINGEALPSGRLPTERRLAERFAVGRGVARRALGELEAEGLIYRHVGRGTFVGSGRQEKATQSVSPAEYIEARLRFEPELAWLIVVNATAADLEVIREQLRRSESANSMLKFENYDANFHQALVNATHNSLMIDMYRVIDGVRRREHAKWGHLHGREQTADQRAIFIREHTQIFEALARRDGKAARDAWSNHLRNTKRRIVDL
jgi:DNA-binding FadR family transcriptional regulator